MLKLRGDLQSGATTWLFPDGLSPTEDITLGQVLLGLAVGCSSLQFLEGLVKLGLDPFLPIGGRSLAHVACEQKAPASLVWLLWMAKHKGRLDDLLHSCDRQGWRPLEAAVRAGWRFGTMFCLAQGCPPVIEGRIVVGC